MNKKYITISFCIIAVVLVFTLVVAGVTKKDNTGNNNDISNPAVSEEVSLKTNEGSYTIKINTVYDAEPLTDEENPPAADRVAVVVYEYTNDDISHGLSIGNTHFKAFDSKGTELQQYPQKDLFQASEIGESGTFTASVAFALNNTENSLILEYYNDVSSVKPDTVYELNW